MESADPFAEIGRGGRAACASIALCPASFSSSAGSTASASASLSCLFPPSTSKGLRRRFAFGWLGEEFADVSVERTGDLFEDTDGRVYTPALQPAHVGPVD